MQFPGAYNEFLAVIDLVNLDLGFILSLACIYDTNFYDRLLMATLGPVVVLLVLGCTYLVARRRNRGSDEVRPSCSCLCILWVVTSLVMSAIYIFSV